MYCHVLLCIAIYYHVYPCIALFYYVLPFIVMYYHVLPGALGGTWVTIVLAAFWLVERGNRKEIGNILKRGSGHRRKASGIIGGTRQASEIIGRDDIIKHKEKTLELLLYDTETWTYICNRFGQDRHVGEIRVPTQCADAQQNAGAVMNLKKKRSKTLRKRENN